MQVVSAVVGGAEAVWLAGVANNCVEVDDRVEVAFTANPLIDGLAVGFAQWARMIVIGTYVWCDRRTDNAESVRVSADNDLLVRGKHPMDVLSMRRLCYFAFAGESA